MGPKLNAFPTVPIAGPRPMQPYPSVLNANGTANPAPPTTATGQIPVTVPAITIAGAVKSASTDREPILLPRKTKTQVAGVVTPALGNPIVPILAWEHSRLNPRNAFP